MSRSGPRRRPSASGFPVLVLAGLAAPLLAAAARPNVEGPLPAHTGGFGEPTCAACHVGGSDAGAVVMLEGLPDRWKPGVEYRFDVVVSADGLARAGFQLAARFADGAAAGRQAGELMVTAERGRTTTDTTGVQYAHHEYDGTVPAEPGIARWTLAWTAPAHGSGAVAFHIAANAANDDNSELGDRIVTHADTVRAR